MSLLGNWEKSIKVIFDRQMTPEESRKLSRIEISSQQKALIIQPNKVSGGC